MIPAKKMDTLLTLRIVKPWGALTVPSFMKGLFIAA
jgi:hypothetical protein